MLTITGQNLTEQAAGRQLSLFEGQEDRHERLVQLESALDGIRDRFGRAAIARASLMRNDLFTAEEADSLPPPDGS
jgi:DNA polymerase-4